MPLTFTQKPLGTSLIPCYGAGNTANGVTFQLLLDNATSRVSALFYDDAGNPSLIPLSIGYQSLTYYIVRGAWNPATGRLYVKWRTQWDAQMNVTEFALSGTPLPTAATPLLTYQYGDALTGGTTSGTIYQATNSEGNIIVTSKSTVIACDMQNAMGPNDADGRPTQLLKIWCLKNGIASEQTVTVSQGPNWGTIKQWELNLAEHSDGGIWCFIQHDSTWSIDVAVFDDAAAGLVVRLTKGGYIKTQDQTNAPDANTPYGEMTKPTPFLAADGFLYLAYGNEAAGINGTPPWMVSGGTFNPGFGTSVARIAVDGTLTFLPVIVAALQGQPTVLTLAVVNGIVCVQFVGWDSTTPTTTNKISTKYDCQLINGAWQFAAQSGYITPLGYSSDQNKARFTALAGGNLVALESA